MGKVFGMLIAGFVIVFLAAFIVAFFVKVAWAYSVSSIFGFREITYVEAYSLSVLGSCLFKSNGFKVDGKN